MLLKQKQAGEQSVSSRCRRRFKFFSSSKMTYKRMESEERKKKMKEAEAAKENCCPVVVSKEENKKKKRSWKRFRTAALTTCRYIGMGMAHMSPATAYSSPDYYVDPKTWNKSFNSCYKPKVQANQTPHWSSHMMYAGW